MLENKKVLHSEHRRAFVYLLCIVAAVIICAASTAGVHAASNFIIEDLDVDVVVNEDDTYDVTETLKVHFTAPSHGIYRTIPLRTRLDRDGQVSEFYAKVSDFTMLSDQPYSKDKGSGKFSMRIGDPDKYADEDTVYKWSFVFDMKGDHLEGADELYYNLVGTTWEARSIDHVSFKVTFPKQIDPGNVGIKTGNNVDVPFESSKDGLVISGETDENVIGGLTIRAVLPEGYFSKQAGGNNIFIYLLTVVLAVLAGAGFLIWRKYGRDPDIIPTEEFYPPENMNPAEVAFYEKQELENKDVVSLLLSLADKGYLLIREIEKPYGIKKRKKKTSYEIEKVKNYDGNGCGEAAFMRGLFPGKNKTVVELSELENKFYKTIAKVKEEIKKRHEDKLFDKKAESYATSLKIAGAAAVIALVILSKILNGSPFIQGGEILMSIIMFVIVIGFFVVGFYGFTNKVNKTKKGFLGFIGYPVCMASGLLFAWAFDVFVGIQFIPFIIGLGMCFILFFLGAICERKTDYYVDILGKIKGYKRFLKVAEKERIEMLAEQDPQYYYRNLAYAFALGVTAAYAKKFAVIANQAPAWYQSTIHHYGTSGPAFDSAVLSTAMDHMMKTASGSMTSSPSSGGSGGGSFSGGGGAGGGGGGSW